MPSRLKPCREINGENAKCPFFLATTISYDFASLLFIRRGCNLKLQLANVHCLTARFLQLLSRVSERVSSVRFMPGYWDYFEEMVRRSARPHILQSIERNAIAIDSLFMRICREWIRMIKFIRLYSKLCNHTLIDRR